MSTPPGPPRRRDAARNRSRLLEAARELMAVRGAGVGHEEIATAAGLGVGTAYRHFPRRQDLLEALFREHIEDVAQLAEQARAHEDPLAGLRHFLTALLERQAAHRGLADVLRGGGHPGLVREASARVTPAVAGLLARARDDGAVGPDVVPGDLVLVEFMVTAVMDASSREDPDLWRRALALLLVALTSPARLPGPVPDGEVVDRLYGGAGGT
jgi:AcrR family transcriptional regulator